MEIVLCLSNGEVDFVILRCGGGRRCARVDGGLGAWKGARGWRICRFASMWSTASDRSSLEKHGDDPRLTRPNNIGSVVDGPSFRLIEPLRVTMLPCVLQRRAVMMSLAEI
jgi:hypothetical protein